LHFLVFFCGTGAVVLFVMRPDLLNSFGGFFGVARGADLLVYISIIFLAYLYFETLNKLTKQKITMTELITNVALLHTNTNFSQIKNSTNKDQFAFLIRAYNEWSVLGWVLQEIIDAGFTKLVLCDDGSTDTTRVVIENIQKNNPQAHIYTIFHPINRWPGAANRTLFTWANKHAEDLQVNWWVTYDADWQMNIADMDTFMEAAIEKVDVLLWSRFMPGWVAHNISWVRRIILWGSKFVTLIFNKIYVTDPTNGYKVIHKDALKKIHIESDGFMYASEFLQEIQEKEFAWKEVPVHIKYTEYSIQKGQKSGNAWKILQSLIYKALFYK